MSRKGRGAFSTDSPRRSLSESDGTALGQVRQQLSLTNSEHLGSAGRAYPLRRGSPVLHRDGPGVLHLPLCPALHTVACHDDLLASNPCRLLRT